MLNTKDNEQIATWCKEKKIDLVVVGPEDPLANGIHIFFSIMLGIKFIIQLMKIFS